MTLVEHCLGAIVYVAALGLGSADSHLQLLPISARPLLEIKKLLCFLEQECSDKTI